MFSTQKILRIGFTHLLLLHPLVILIPDLLVIMNLCRHPKFSKRNLLFFQHPPLLLLVLLSQTLQILFPVQIHPRIHRILIHGWIWTTPIDLKSDRTILEETIDLSQSCLKSQEKRQFYDLLTEYSDVFSLRDEIGLAPNMHV